MNVEDGKVVFVSKPNHFEQQEQRPEGLEAQETGQTVGATRLGTGWQQTGPAVAMRR